jgi:hypothetical protein
MNEMLIAFLDHYDHAVYMKEWKQADYWWKAIELLLKDQLEPQSKHSATIKGIGIWHIDLPGNLSTLRVSHKS